MRHQIRIHKLQFLQGTWGKAWYPEIIYLVVYHYRQFRISELHAIAFCNIFKVIFDLKRITGIFHRNNHFPALKTMMKLKCIHIKHVQLRHCTSKSYNLARETRRSKRSTRFWGHRLAIDWWQVSSVSEINLKSKRLSW